MRNLKASFSVLLGTGSLFLILTLIFTACKNPANDSGNTTNDPDNTASDPGHTHVWGEWDNSTATCTIAGIETRTCTIDATHTETRPAAALGHDMAWVITTPATFLAAGEETYACRREGCTYTEGTHPIPQLTYTATGPWTARTAAEANIWTSITYGNGLFVAVASDGVHRVMTAEGVRE